MHKPTISYSQSFQEMDWLEYLNDCLPALVVPVGTRFQADVPEWRGASKKCYVNGDTDTSRWLGTRVWPLENDPKDYVVKVGKGRQDVCNCSYRGSAQCVMQHVSEARTRLKSSLGPAFKSWKFDEMGEDVGKSWTSMEKNIFHILVKSNPLSQGKSFLRPAEKTFPSKTRKVIVSYYLNVYVPKLISLITRSICTVFDSDDDDEVEQALNVENSLKRSRSDNEDSTKLGAPKVAKSHYLNGRR